MNAVAECPHCGLPLADHGTNGSKWDGSSPDGAREDKRRIEELTREVRLLQKTVAQLRSVRR
jgi:hypothetical protein